MGRGKFRHPEILSEFRGIAPSTILCAAVVKLVSNFFPAKYDLLPKVN